jgi:hypothetical protein
MQQINAKIGLAGPADFAGLSKRGGARSSSLIQPEHLVLPTISWLLIENTGAKLIGVAMAFINLFTGARTPVAPETDVEARSRKPVYAAY